MSRSICLCRKITEREILGSFVVFLDPRLEGFERDDASLRDLGNTH